MNRLWPFLCLVVACGQSPASVPVEGGTPDAESDAGLGNTSGLFQSQSDNRADYGGSIPRYGRFEIAFTLSRVVPNPYYFYDATTSPDGITVEARFTSPTGRSLVVPAFWDEPMARVRSGGAEVLGGNGAPGWRVRFAPDEVGTWSYVLAAEDKVGSDTWGPFTVAAATSPSHGFVRVSPRDSRYLEFDDGTFFLPITDGHQWPRSSSAAISFDYEDAFAQFAAHGINATRVWSEMDWVMALDGTTRPKWSEYGAWYCASCLVMDTTGGHGGLRAAEITMTPQTARNDVGWLEHVAVSPSTSYTLSAWVRTQGVAASGAGGGAVISGGGTGAPSRTSAAQTGDAGWTQITTTFTTGASDTTLDVWLGLKDATGTAWFDDVALTPANATWNAIVDGGFERHFCGGCAGTDPTQGSTIPLGTFINQSVAAELDGIVFAAEKNGVYLQLLSGSGPWYTWVPDHGEFGDARTLENWKRNFRYRVARWGYSTSILAWEHWNELGNVAPQDTTYDFYQQYGAYQAATDPFRHLRTTSQGSQTWSPELWTSSALDLANYHDYITTGLPRYWPEIFDDEVRFIYELAACMVRGGQACVDGATGNSLGISDAGLLGKRPIFWGEYGVETTWNVNDMAGTSGPGGDTNYHDVGWAGVFSEATATPTDWNWEAEGDPTDPQSTLAHKQVSRQILKTFFDGVDFPSANFVRLWSADLDPKGYAGPHATPSDSNVRALVLRRGDGAGAYAWIQNLHHTWINVANGVSIGAPAGTVTIPGMAAGSYTVTFVSPYTGATLHTDAVAADGSGNLAVTLPQPLDGTLPDVAVKITK